MFLFFLYKLFKEKNFHFHHINISHWFNFAEWSVHSDRPYGHIYLLTFHIWLISRWIWRESLVLYRILGRKHLEYFTKQRHKSFDTDRERKKWDINWNTEKNDEITLAQITRQYEEANQWTQWPKQCNGYKKIKIRWMPGSIVYISNLRTRPEKSMNA